MKKILIFLISATCIAITLVSCEKEDEFFEKSLLTGKWQSHLKPTLFDRYFSNGTGYTWDEGDDVQEHEAQKFTWELEGSRFTLIHEMEHGGVPVPKVFTVTELTSTSLKYRNLYGKSYSFTRVD
jgi:hypothetical protein